MPQSRDGTINEGMTKGIILCDKAVSDVKKPLVDFQNTELLLSNHSFQQEKKDKKHKYGKKVCTIIKLCGLSCVDCEFSTLCLCSVKV